MSTKDLETLKKAFQKTSLKWAVLVGKEADDSLSFFSLGEDDKEHSQAAYFSDLISTYFEVKEGLSNPANKLPL